jgi:hypothetical protein
MPSTRRSLIWRNWHETVSQTVRRFEVLRNPDESKSTLAGYNATTRRIQELILEAAEQDTSLRAVGGAWSFTPIAATEGILLATQRLNYRFALAPSQLRQNYTPDTMPVLLQCGISVADINKYLAGRGQAVPTSGASNGQTIAGALATGTHGAAIDVGAIPDYVVAIHLACVPDGKTLWLERQSHPVLTDDTITRLEAEPLRDDDVFDAALVSFGCFGVVLGVVIEPVKLYYLHAWRQPIVLDDAVWTAIESMDFSNVDLPGPAGSGVDRRRPYHLELLVNVLDGGRTTITVMYRAPDRPPGAGSARPDGGFGKGDSALDAIGVITDGWDGIAPLAAKLFTLAYKPYENVAGTPAEVFRDTSTRGRSASSAMGVPLDRARRVVDIAADAVRRTQAPAFVSVRFVKATRATLGFTFHQPATAIVEVDGAHSNRTLEAQRLVWRAVETQGIPHAFHWGKMNDLDAATVRRAFGQDRVNRWIAARQRLIPLELRRVFANGFSDQLDLSR